MKFKTLKLLTTLLLIICVCVSAVSCGADDAGAVSTYTPGQIAEVIIATQTDVSNFNPATGVLSLNPLTADDSLFADYITAQYRLEISEIKDGIVYYADGAVATEIAVILMADGKNVKKASDALLDYKERRISVLTGYLPEQAELVESGLVVTRGAYAALLICSDKGNAEKAFVSCFGKTPPKLPDRQQASGNPQTGDVSAGGNVNADDHDGRNSADQGSADQSSIDDRPSGDATDSNGAGTPNEDGGQGDVTGDHVNQSAENSPAGVAESSDNNDDHGAEAGNPERIGDDPQTNGVGEQAASSDLQNPSEDPSQSTGQTQPPSSERSPTDDEFDPAAILAVWKTYGASAVNGSSATNGASTLNEKNRKILEACIEVIDTYIKAGMTDYQKELVIHDWIVGWTTYDVEASSNSPTAQPDPHNDTPYGVFFSRKSICSGYSSTFQLFMDMLGIECITVRGYAREMWNAHAWNMVRLDGEWYCVDVTWDDPVGAPADYLSHDFFNVTSRYLRDTKHIWDESKAPEATATAYSWAEMS